MIKPNADAVRWCEPYASDIMRHHADNERAMPPSTTIETDRCVIVNWMCNATRRVRYRSETFWTAVCTFDRYLATDPGQVEDLQCIAAACVHLAASYQETATVPRLQDIASACNYRFDERYLRACCWKIVRALGADLYWPSPLTFYRHYSRLMRFNTFEHTMTKFIVETIAFAHQSLLTHYQPSTLASAAIFVARWCAHRQVPSAEWIAEWRAQCAQAVSANCVASVYEWVVSVLENRVNPLDSVLRRYGHIELFCVSQRAHLPSLHRCTVRELVSGCSGGINSDSGGVDVGSGSDGGGGKEDNVNKLVLF